MASSSSSRFQIGKASSRTTNGRWHLFKKNKEYSLCGQFSKNSDSMHERLSLKSFNPDKEEFDEVIGLGQKCRSCSNKISGNPDYKNIKVRKRDKGNKRNNLLQGFKA